MEHNSKEKEGYRKAFAHFDVETVAHFNEDKIQQLKNNPEIVRNEQEIRATVNNARRFMEIQQKHGSFCKYIWSFVNGKPINNRWQSLSEIPSSTAQSEKLAADLKKRGFKFVGATTIYAHMQATGLVNDHEISCFKASGGLQNCNENISF
ncbi:MAG: DNA-3-methyladenine glycosylase I [Balneolaceae bacterium]|nr:DNA-3-methyladenine glycosylase I [Balneolaceae bacterium]